MTRHHTGRDEGQALVELALVLVALCSLVISTFDFGQIVNVYLVTVHATREAARVASVAGTSVAAVQSGVSDSPSNTCVACRDSGSA